MSTALVAEVEEDIAEDTASSDEDDEDEVETPPDSPTSPFNVVVTRSSKKSKDSERQSRASVPPLHVVRLEPTVTIVNSARESPGKESLQPPAPARRRAMRGNIMDASEIQAELPHQHVLTEAFAGSEITPRQRMMEQRLAKKNKGEMAGVFCDFMARMNPNTPNDRRMSVGAKGKRRSIETVRGDGKELGFRMALTAVHREQLMSEIMQAITKFKKSYDDPDWRSGLKEFQQQAKRLLDFKKEYGCLNIEVENYLLRRRLMAAAALKAAPESSEKFEERRDRLKGFWSQYHASSKKIEVFQGSAYPSSGMDRTASLGSSNKQLNTNAQTWPYDNKRKVGNSKTNFDKNVMKTSTSLPALSKTIRGPTFNIERQNHVRASQRCRSNNRNGDVEVTVELPPISPVSPTTRYMRICQDNRIVPTLLPFVTGHSLKFRAGQKTLVDNDLMAVTVMIPNMDQIEEVDLAGNGLLTERSLVPFMEKLALNPAIATLRRLDLSQCRQVGQCTLQLLVGMLSSHENVCSASKLQTLDLSGIAVSARILVPLCKAIRMNKSLKSVNMVDIGLGKNGGAHRLLDDLLGSSSIENLDLGWNSFGPEDFAKMGQKLAVMQKLVSLRLANCSVASNYYGNIPVICPITFLIEMLSQNHSLKMLDVSLNRIDSRAALMLEDALERHSELQELNVSHNPLAVLGMRSMLRLLSRSESGLKHFTCDSCSTGSEADDPMDRAQVFSQSNPGGRYKLDLVRPYHRTLLRMLYKTSERFGVSPSDAFLDMHYTLPPYQHPAKTLDNIWPVRTEGKLTVTLSLEKGLETALKGIPDGAFKEFLRCRDGLMRMKPAFDKTVPLFAQWKSIHGLELEQRVFLAALSKDFLITYPQLESLARSSRHFTSDIITSLLPCVIGGEGVRYLTLLLTPSLKEYINNHAKLANLLDFSPENPTGPYKLDLGKSADHIIGESLFLLDRWEVGVGRRLHRKDVSQRGNRSHIRNPRFQDRPLEFSSVAEWNMPECDILEFDYVSSKRPQPGSLVLDDNTFNNVLVVLQSSFCKPAVMTAVLRQVSDHFYITALQLRSLLGSFLESSDRAEVFVIFFMRVKDMHNEKVFRVRFEDEADLEKLRHRLGYATMFAFIQPEQSAFKLNFKYHDERLTANILLALKSKESQNVHSKNVRDEHFVHENGVEDPLTLGVPRAWESFEKMPTSGTFSCNYNCAPEDRCVAERKRLMHDYGFWTVDVNDNDIMWWSALTEAPTDVLEFLEFIVGHFKDVWQAFTKIDGGADGNGVISWDEFSTGVKAMHCNKFQGEDEMSRIHAIFHYLDPSGEGTVSRDEWGIMEQLWKEMQLSIKEFVNFLKNQFDCDEDEQESEMNSVHSHGKDFLDVAFEYLDADGSDEIDEKEWQEAVRDRLKYFGPCACIFGFLDKDDEGTITIDEFKALKQFDDDDASMGGTGTSFRSTKIRTIGLKSIKP